jgi:hypothetical protein
MATPTAAPAKAVLDSAQRAWLTKMGTALDVPVEAAAGDTGSTTTISDSPRAADAPVKDVTPADLVLAWGPEVIALLKTLGARRVCLISVVNKTTDRILFRGTPKFKNGGLAKLPKEDKIEPNGGKMEFVAASPENNPIGKIDGEIPFILDFDTNWHVRFKHPRFGEVEASSELDESPAKAKYFPEDPPLIGNGDTAEIRFTLFGGGPAPPPPPPPGPKPTGQDIASSCIITVTNNTKFPLTLGNSDHEKGRGNFMNLPQPTIQPNGGTATIISIETPNSKDEGCKGFIEWNVGSPEPCVWRIEWDNPEGAQNDSKSTLTPEVAGLRPIDQIGQGEENVPVMFTLSGEGGGTGPVPPPPPPEVEPEFPADEAKQPTLRMGDNNVDGWVEFLQSSLIKHLGDKIDQEINGDFNQKTKDNVLLFQRTHKPKLLDDGIVGNQTWAALRKAPAEPIGTDGRKPHTFVEKGPEARWACEKTDFGIQYDPKTDEMALALVSVGDERVDNFKAKVSVTPPNGKKVDLPLFTIGKPTAERESGAGHVHKIIVAKFLKTFGPGTHVIEAQLEKKLGGDKFKDKFSVSAQKPTGAVVVTVNNAATNKPIGKATVQIANVSSETEDSGLADIDGIPPGQQPFRVTARGFEEARGTVEVSGNEDAADTLRVKLKPQPVR